MRTCRSDDGFVLGCLIVGRADSDRSAERSQWQRRPGSRVQVRASFSQSRRLLVLLRNPALFKLQGRN
eukprot:3723815-Rhodomonas_salina.2